MMRRFKDGASAVIFYGSCRETFKDAIGGWTKLRRAVGVHVRAVGVQFELHSTCVFFRHTDSRWGCTDRVPCLSVGGAEPALFVLFLNPSQPGCTWRCADTHAS